MIYHHTKISSPYIASVPI